MATFAPGQVSDPVPAPGRFIVLKLLDTRKQQVGNSVKHKAADNENFYDKAIEEAVLQLFGLTAEPRSRTVLEALRSHEVASLVDGVTKLVQMSELAALPARGDPKTESLRKSRCSRALSS